MKNNVLTIVSLLQEKIVKEIDIKNEETKTLEKLWQAGFVAGLQEARDIILNNSQY